jgi:hypothetical protein
MFNLNIYMITPLAYSGGYLILFNNGKTLRYR